MPCIVVPPSPFPSSSSSPAFCIGLRGVCNTGSCDRYQSLQRSFGLVGALRHQLRLKDLGLQLHAQRASEADAMAAIEQELRERRWETREAVLQNAVHVLRIKNALQEKIIQGLQTKLLDGSHGDHSPGPRPGPRSVNPTAGREKEGGGDHGDYGAGVGQSRGRQPHHGGSSRAERSDVHGVVLSGLGELERRLGSHGAAASEDALAPQKRGTDTAAAEAETVADAGPFASLRALIDSTHMGEPLSPKVHALVQALSRLQSGASPLSPSKVGSRDGPAQQHPGASPSPATLTPRSKMDLLRQTEVREG